MWAKRKNKHRMVARLFRFIKLNNEMIKRLLHIQTGKAYRCILCFCLVMLSLTASAESYTLSVGESVTITQSALNGGYIDNVGLANYLDPHLGFSRGWDGSATISVNSYFDYTATVQLVFVERYQSYYAGRYHTRQETYYRDVEIKCRYTAPDPSKKPTKVIVPERVRVSLGGTEYVTPSIEPYGATVTKIAWYKSSGGAYYNLKGSGNLNDLRGIVTGKSLGIGRAYVELNDDDNLKAYFDIEVVDPDNLPPTGIILPSSYEISVGGHTTIEPVLSPSNSSTSYTWSSDNTNVAIVAGGKVTGVAVGTTTVKVKTANNLTASCTVKVVNANGQDDEADGDVATMGIINGREYVDLGLSVKWATYDVGASKQSEEGPKYAWGETASKTEFSWANYKYGSSVFDVTNIGSNIKGTQYDAAFVKWGSDWCMPSETEAREMLSKCTFSVDYVDGVKGYRVLGPNGNSIFIPEIGRHWTSSLDSRSDYPEYATCINIYYNTQIWPYTWVASYAHEMRMKGLRIRAVTSSDATNSGTQPSSISLSVSSMKVQKDEKVPMAFTVSPSNATTTLRWESNNPSVASVSGSGLVTAIKDGTAIISVTTGNGKVAQCTLTVGNGSLEQLQLSASPSGGEVTAGTKVYLSTPNASGADIYYTLNGNTPSKSSTKYTSSGITINSSCTLKAIAYKDGYEASDVLTATYTIKDEMMNPTSIRIRRDLLSMKPTDTYHLTYSYRYPFGTSSSQEANPSVTWTSSNSSVVKVSNGDLTAVSTGTAVITVKSSNNLSASCTVTVIPQSELPKWGIKQVSAGGHQTMILKTDGSLWACGYNSDGQLGDGTTTNRSTPVQVMTGVAAVSAGGSHTMILKTDGSLWACGDNYYGQLCDGTNVGRHIPVQIAEPDKSSTLPKHSDIVLSSAGYATFFSSESAYTLPNGLSAHVVTGLSNDKLTTKTIADGSVAILTTINGEQVTKEDLAYYATEEFSKFYSIARNRGTRSLNIDNNSVFFFGKLK